MKSATARGGTDADACQGGSWKNAVVGWATGWLNRQEAVVVVLVLIFVVQIGALFFLYRDNRSDQRAQRQEFLAELASERADFRAELKAERAAHAASQDKDRAVQLELNRQLNELVRAIAVLAARVEK